MIDPTPSTPIEQANKKLTLTMWTAEDRWRQVHAFRRATGHGEASVAAGLDEDNREAAQWLFDAHAVQR
jgi:hypothetical protein